MGSLRSMSVPNFELLSFKEIFSFETTIIACTLETDMSDILRSQSWPLPYFDSDEKNFARYFYNFEVLII